MEKRYLYWDDDQVPNVPFITYVYSSTDYNGDAEHIEILCIRVWDDEPHPTQHLNNPRSPGVLGASQWRHSWVPNVIRSPVSIQRPSFSAMYFHHKNKTVARSFYLYNGNFYTGGRAIAATTRLIYRVWNKFCLKKTLLPTCGEITLRKYYDCVTGLAYHCTLIRCHTQTHSQRSAQDFYDLNADLISCWP